MVVLAGNGLAGVDDRQNCDRDGGQADGGLFLLNHRGPIVAVAAGAVIVTS